jgi:hypothetical protein
MDSYDGYGSPGRSRESDSFAGRPMGESYRRRSPGKPIIEDYYSELGAKLTLSQPLKIDDVHGRAPARP